jgi:chemotaxis signal transduction protein
MTPTAVLTIDRFLPFMRDVVRCEQSLRELNLMWRMIESSAKLSCPTEAQTILPTMAATRVGFEQLEHELVASLVGEKVSTVLNEISTKAQYVIDIVVRNLYERTADVGFLATDAELCRFVAGLHDDQGATRLRLRAYRSKYTVYDEIILLDCAGNVLVQIDETTPLEGSVDPLIAETLACDTYVETFRYSDLRPAKKQALIYSRRMLHPRTGAVVGLLCLCFHFEEEMKGIFQSHGDPQGRSIMLLMDRNNRVIESADPLWIPLGATVPVNRNASPQVVLFSGREYLASTVSAQGYQGYAGPSGWQGQVMVPVDVAFTGPGSCTLDTLSPSIADGLLSHAQSFSPPLFKIMNAVDTIQRVVWNGQIMTAGKSEDALKLKTILKQISETGVRSNSLFSSSIADLYETVLACSLRDSEFMSNLLVDLLDRNLYERADDCRWWALTPVLRRVLALAQPSARDIQQTTELLAYINSLYTVYTQIFVYDALGHIVASSKPDPLSQTLNEQLDTHTLSKVHGLRSEQDYFVTPFAPTPLYGERPTYTYHAAIRHPDDDQQIVGGIGIVFDSEVELLAMLRGGLAGKTGATALFVQRSGRVIASTDPRRPIGSVLELEPALLSLANGSSASRIVLHDGNYAIMGCTMSDGYREFKVSDGYVEDVLAVVFTNFGEIRERPGANLKGKAALTPTTIDADSQEFATFLVNGILFSLPAHNVVEALPATQISSMAHGDQGARIGLLGLQAGEAGAGSVWVYDLAFLVHKRRASIARSSQVVIVRYQGQTFGLLVDALHGVPEFSPVHLMPNPFTGHPDSALIKQLIKANDGQLLIHCIDVHCLATTLSGRLQAVAA